MIHQIQTGGLDLHPRFAKENLSIRVSEERFHCQDVNSCQVVEYDISWCLMVIFGDVLQMRITAVVVCSGIGRIHMKLRFRGIRSQGQADGDRRTAISEERQEMRLIGHNLIHPVSIRAQERRHADQRG